MPRVSPGQPLSHCRLASFRGVPTARGVLASRSARTAGQMRLGGRLGSCWCGDMAWVSAFTGRADELGLLSQGVREGATTLVVADAGMGKTRLVAECGAEFE